MYYTVYKTTNKKNGKIYVGCHKTKDLDDGYLGSGLLLKRAIEKHGIENFEKEILAVFEKSSDMFNMESELVNEDFLKRDDIYNLKLGGEGGFDHINNNRTKEEHIRISSLGGQAAARKITPEKWKEISAQGVAAWRELRKDPVWMKIYGKKISDANKGKSKTEEHKRKIGKANSIKQKGSGNSQFGTIWITNGLESKKIKKDDMIPENWYRGRKK